MHTVLSITAVIVALFGEYSTNVWSTASRRFGKYGIKALGDIRVTPSTQRNMEALVPVEATKPGVEIIEHVTDKVCLKTVESKTRTKTLTQTLLEIKEQHRIHGHGLIPVNVTVEVDFIARFRTQTSGCWRV
ncbi:unnamed protein product [Dicrocoelium dendriticum]|nr:unnamed protein product [Dicrocoelium dendriticum]